MACNPDFVQFIIDQCSDAGEIAVKKMMGDWCAYCDGILFGLICDNNFYIKVTVAIPLVSHASAKSTAGFIPHLSNPGNGENHHSEPQKPDCHVAVDTMTWQR